MKVALNWLKELVNYKLSKEELADLLAQKTIGIKAVTDLYIELDMKGYNRADLLSLRGVALEVSAVTDTQVKFTDEIPQFDLSLPKTPVSIEDESLCKLQIVAKIEGLKVSASAPEWIKKLKDSGMRSVNNIADVTNLIMLEYGQPLHAFNASTVKDDTINVRIAKEGEVITTLDGNARKLNSEDIVLADTEKALDVAGVMGGKDTEISHQTISILLSASLFNPQMVRKTSQRLKLQSEASKRFYHGLTKLRLLQSLDAAIKMYQSLGGKLTALTIVGDVEDSVKKINLSLNRVNSLIGVELSDGQIRSFLEKFGFHINDVWAVTIPFWRLDIEVEEDLIEEVARMYGYDKIPSLKLKGELPEKVDQKLFELISELRTKLVHLGLTEIQTYSFFSNRVLVALGWNNNLDSLIKITNPMSTETTYLRQSIWPNLIEAVDKNLRQGFEDLALFEIGKTYSLNSDQSINEKFGVSLVLTNTTDNPLQELNQIIKTLALEVEIKSANPPDIVKEIFHPSRFLEIKKEKQVIGGMAEVHPRVLDKFGITKRVAVLEINLE